MKIPIQCPRGCGFTLEIDWNKDHQHVQCHECTTEYCAVCFDRVTIEEAELLKLREDEELLNLVRRTTDVTRRRYERLTKAYLN